MNTIFIMSDTFRYDNLICYGPTPVKTPRLDKFASESFVFDNAYLGSFPTVPNRLDIMSGRFSFIDHEWGALPAKTVTLQQILSASGIVTEMIIDNPHLLEEGYNYCRGFKGYEWIRGQETDNWKTAPVDPQPGVDPKKLRSGNFIVKQILRNRAGWHCEEDRYTPRTIRTACQWLEENQAAPKFFLYLDLFDPHEPWDAPQKYVDLYDPNHEGEDIFYPRYDFWRRCYNNVELNRLRALYMAEVSMVDHWMGVLFDKIEELGMAEDTAVVFCSDHGYLFGEHELTGKSLFPEVNGKMQYEAIPMYDEIRRIPLLIRLPGQTTGKHVRALVQSPDLMPTVLELSGLVATESVAGQAQTKALQCGVFVTEDWSFAPDKIHGKSLLPLLHGGTDRLRDIAVCSNTLIHHTPVLAKCAIVTEDGWCLHYAGKYDQMASAGTKTKGKVIGRGDPQVSLLPELYNLTRDPHEAQNVIASYGPLAQEIHERYVRFLEEIETPAENSAGRRSL